MGGSMNGTYGPAYEADIDGERIQKQHEKIRSFMLGSGWRTLREIEQYLHYPQASISAQLRHLRKKQFGGYIVNKQRRGTAWEYMVIVPVKEVVQMEFKLT
jgi:hypothetical protein